ncbi:MAG: hypothetical protein IPK73_03675 [Candidatus Obscuribacter sp.]|nr:hypothetical protein [Candidatus Obscuribacter sp.]
MGISLKGKVGPELGAEAQYAEPAPAQSWYLRAAAAVLFALVLAAHLIHHFLFDHALVMFAFDGKHYLETTRLLTEAGQLLVSNPAAFNAAISAPHFISYMLWDGPAIPGLPALVFLALGRLPTANDWMVYCLLLSSLAAGSAVLVMLICKDLYSAAASKSRSSQALKCLTLPFLAGLAYGLYPSTLVATGVNRSETLATFLVMVFIYAGCRLLESRSALIVTGITGGLLALTKPVLIPVLAMLYAYFAVVPVTLSAVFTGSTGERLRIFSASFLRLLLLGVVTIATISPWCLYSGVKAGKVAITAERGPSYNAGVGTDLEMDGWCTTPESNHVNLMKVSDSPGSVLAAIWVKQPMELTALTLRRVARLWCDPWNDFREVVFGLSPQGQRYVHVLMLFLGLGGGYLHLINLFRRKTASRSEESGSGSSFPALSSRQSLLLDLLVLFVLSHSAFAVFQAMARYAFTAMAALYCLAFFLLLMAFRLKDGALRAYLLPSLLLSAGTLLALYSIEPLSTAGRLQEEPVELSAGESLYRYLDITGTSARGAQALLLVDSDGACEGLKARVNGVELSGSFRPFNQFSSSHYFLFDTMAEHGAQMRTAVQDFRQWRALPVNGALLKDGRNVLQVTNGAGVPLTIYGDRPGAGAFCSSPQMSWRLPSPDYFGSDRMLVSVTSLESRIASLRPAFGFKAQGKEVQPRLLLALSSSPRFGASPVSTQLRVPFQSVSSVTLPLDCKRFHWFSRGEEDTLVVNKDVLKAVGVLTTQLPCRLTSDGAAPLTQVRLTLRGQARCLSGPGRLGVDVAIKSPSRMQGLGCVPDFISVGKDWTDFSVSDMVPLAFMGGNIDGVSVGFAPCPRLETQYGPGRHCSNLRLRNLQVTIEGVASYDLGYGKIRYY